jgi:hypothetical protein
MIPSSLPTSKRIALIDQDKFTIITDRIQENVRNE